MTKPMYCPMSFTKGIEPLIEEQECTPNCAWVVETQDGRYGCGMILINAKVPILGVNTRSLKSDINKGDIR